MRSTHRIVCLSLALAVSACSASETTMTTNDASPPDAVPAARADHYRLNPHPTQGYRITMTVADAPGPFASIEGIAQYQAPDCWYTLDSVEGVPANPERVLPIAYAKVDDNTYVGTVYLDAMLDEDYFGSGVCKWTLTSAHVSLRATGAAGETEFVASLQKDSLVAHERRSLYYMKRDYPVVHEIENYRDFGQPNRSDFASYIKDDDLFHVILSSTRVMP